MDDEHRAARKVLAIDILDRTQRPDQHRPWRIDRIEIDPQPVLAVGIRPAFELFGISTFVRT